MEDKLKIIILAVLLTLSILMYIKKRNEETAEDFIQNYQLASHKYLIEVIKNKLRVVQSNCNNKIAQDSALIDLQNQLLEEVSIYVDGLDETINVCKYVIANNGIISYGPIDNKIILRFLNPDSIVTMMMLMDKINVNKMNNQTYTDKLNIIDKLFGEIKDKVLVTSVINQADILTSVTNKMNEMRTRYIESIVSDFDQMNITNRKISENIISLNLEKYGVFMIVEFSNISSYNNLKYGLDISNFIDWKVLGKDGTDINILSSYIIDKSNYDIIEPLNKKVVGNLNDKDINVLKNLGINFKKADILSEIKMDLKKHK